MRRSATVRLVCVVAGIGAVWCWLLPAVQRFAVVERHVAAMELREVNPAAITPNSTGSRYGRDGWRIA